MGVDIRATVVLFLFLETQSLASIIENIGPPLLPLCGTIMRIDKVVIYTFAILCVLTVSILVFARTCNETTEVNVTKGDMRVVSSFLGCDYREIHVDAGLGWVANVMDADTPDRWIPYSENRKRLLERECVREKRVGMVYWDATTLAGLLFKDQALKVELDKIANADYHSIWDIRSGYMNQLHH